MNEFSFQTQPGHKPFTETYTVVRRYCSKERTCIGLITPEGMSSAGGEDKPVLTERVGYHAVRISRSIFQDEHAAAVGNLKGIPVYLAVVRIHFVNVDDLVVLCVQRRKTKHCKQSNQNGKKCFFHIDYC